MVGANPAASNVHRVEGEPQPDAAYVVAAVLYATAGVLLAAVLRAPGVTVGAPYLLGPIAAVVIGGASLTGGLASPISTWAAAFFLAGLNQMMRVHGASHRTPVRRLRPGDHWRDAGLGRPDHQRRRKGFARPVSTGRRREGRLAVEGGETVRKGELTIATRKRERK